MGRGSRCLDTPEYKEQGTVNKPKGRSEVDTTPAMMFDASMDYYWTYEAAESLEPTCKYCYGLLTAPRKDNHCVVKTLDSALDGRNG